MNPELLYVASLLAKMLVTGLIVITASIITERVGPLIGALVITLPITTGPAYVFLALDHDAAFLAKTALGGLSANAVNAVFFVIYTLTAQRHGLFASLRVATLGWIAIIPIVQAHDWTLAQGVLLNVIVFGSGIFIVRRFRDAPVPYVKREWYDIPFRAVLIALLVGAVVGLSATLGPWVTGALSVYPVAMTSAALILHNRIGGPALAALFANGLSGLLGFIFSLSVVHLTIVPLGVPLSLTLALIAAMSWNIFVWLTRRGGWPI